jgi:hypothetical protein
MRSLMKRFIIFYLTVLLSSLLISLSGCGTADVGFHTKINPSGSVAQDINIEATGVIGGLLSEQFDTGEMETLGWYIQTEKSTDSFKVIASKTFSRDEAVEIFTGAESPASNTKVNVTGNLLYRNYRFETTLKGTQGDSTSSLNDEITNMGEALSNSMFNFHWSVTVPGTIVSTNADKKEGNTATWNFSLTSLESDRYMIIEARYINWPVIIGGASVLIVIIAAAIFLPLYLRRKKQKTLVSVISPENKG